MKYKTFKEFFWKSALIRVGLPWGFVTGLLFAIIQDDNVLTYFSSTETIIQIMAFTFIGGLLMAYGAGKSFWNRSEKNKEES